MRIQNGEQQRERKKKYTRVKDLAIGISPDDCTTQERFRLQKPLAHRIEVCRNCKCFNRMNDYNHTACIAAKDTLIAQLEAIYKRLGR